jgi:hypothetical protein
MHRTFAKVSHGGTPVSWLGANFWSRSGGPLMWSRYDPCVIRDELTVLREHGLTMTRSFFYWPDVMPAPHQLDKDQWSHSGAAPICVPPRSRCLCWSARPAP